MIRFMTAGESHGQALIALIEGIPAGLKLQTDLITVELRRRQMGYGRGKRMRIERDTAEVLTGLWNGETIGSPISIVIRNRDWENWRGKKQRAKTVPRPGHADLPAVLKYGFIDIQCAIERASARETAARVAAGAVAKQYLSLFHIRIFSYTRRIGSAIDDSKIKFSSEVITATEKSKVRCVSKTAEKAMIREIDKAVEAGDTLGGVAEVVATGVPVGLGSYVHWDRRADGRLAAAMMSIQSVKAVEIGEGISAASAYGSTVHDPILHSRERVLHYGSNNAGGITGGITTGEDIVVRCYFKPISTLGTPLPSVDLKTKRRTEAPYVRSDICIVPAGGIVGEAMMALVLADLMSEKFGGDSVREVLANYQSYLKYVSRI